MTDDTKKSEPLAVIHAEDVIWSYDDKTVFEEGKALAVLLDCEAIFLNSHHWEDEWPEAARKTTALCVNCNDVFAWGCADAESANYHDIEDLYRHWSKDPNWGTAVWCIKRRNQMPQKPVYDRIQRAGIWNLDEMGLGPNTLGDVVKAALAAAKGEEKQ